MLHWTAFRLGALASLVALAAACAAFDGAPAPIPKDQILALGADNSVATSGTPGAAHGGDQLRGYLSYE